MSDNIKMKLMLIPDHVPDLKALVLALSKEVVPLIYSYNAPARTIHRDVVFNLFKYKRGQFDIVTWIVFRAEDGTMSYKRIAPEENVPLSDQAFHWIMDVLRIYVSDDAFLHMVIKQGCRVVGDKVYKTAGPDAWSLQGVCADVNHLFRKDRIST